MEAREDPLGEVVELLLVPASGTPSDSAQLSGVGQRGGDGRHAYHNEASVSSGG